MNENQEDELVNDLKECDTEPQNDLQLDSIPSEAKALSKWILVYLFFIQASYKLSNTVVSMLLIFFHIFLMVLGLYSAIAKHIVQCLPPHLCIQLASIETN